MSTWLEPHAYWAGSPAVHAAAGALITGPGDTVLLVKPTYTGSWAFPGGQVDEGELPHDACAREVREELGLDLPVGPLLTVDWAPPDGPRTRAMVHLLFDCGELGADPPVRLPADELSEWAYLDPAEAARRLPPHAAPRIAAALAARRGGAVYLPAVTSPGAGATPPAPSTGGSPG